MKVLYLIRGVSGSGKTTLATKMASELDLMFYEADQFFYADGFGHGSYRFDGSKLGDAHTWCKSMVSKEMFDGHDVIVSNTFTQYWEIKGYLELAKKYGYKVHMIHCTGEYENVHGVPAGKVQEMKNRFESNESVYEKCENDGFDDMVKYE